MTKLNTTSVSLAVTPTVVSTLFSHYLNRKPLKERPTAHLSYDEGLHLIRSFLEFSSQHTVEELQAFTAQWVPHPQWIKVDDAAVPEEHLARAAELLEAQLGPDGVRQVGGRKWWQWRIPKSPLGAEWIEMRADASERKRNNDPGRRVMMYIHGGGYYFGSVDEHRYQMQRHARKLKAKVFAPKYRLSPQFPFPCGLYDCLAAYLYLLTVQDPSTIILAGDSAGGGMAMALMVILRDQGIPLPAGAVLISPWVDLTHSFPSLMGGAPMDYIPECGFHHKPSQAWPPPNDDDLKMLHEEAKKRKEGAVRKQPATSELRDKQQASVAPQDEETRQELSEAQAASGGIVEDPDKYLSLTIDGQLVTIKDQIQMYTTNGLLAHPLVSPIMQPTLGGLPPLLIMVGGGEILRDEQIYLAHKCANPTKYAPPPEVLTEKGKALLDRYKPTDVQLQVWDDLCHVGPTLSFTRPAKYMYRSISQFGAWALARAQHRGIDIMDDDQISVISTSGSDSGESSEQRRETQKKKEEANSKPGSVGKAGDPLPPFMNHMIRQQVTRHGKTYVLKPESELPGCCMSPASLGVVKPGVVKKWLDKKKSWDEKFATSKAKVHGKIIKDMVVGYHDFGPGENPPPTALAGRRRVDSELKQMSRRKSLGLALWSLWGSKHDEATVEREKKAEQEPETYAATSDEGQGARPFSDIETQTPVRPGLGSRSRSRHKYVVDENQTGVPQVDENTAVAELIELRKKEEAAQDGMLGPDYVPPTGAAGKRPFLDGIALPFTLKKEADTASMMTLQSAVSPAPTTRTKNPFDSVEAVGKVDGESRPASTVVAAEQRPGLETFVTAGEELPKAGEANGNAKAAA